MNRRFIPLCVVLLGLTQLTRMAGYGGGTQPVVSQKSRRTPAVIVTPTRRQVGSAEDVWQLVDSRTKSRISTRAITTAPTPVSPVSDTEVFQGDSITFQWTPVSGARKYLVEVSPYSSFSPKAYRFQSTTTSKTISKVPATVATGRYYWRVRATDNPNANPANTSQWGPPSSTATFIVSTNICGDAQTGTVNGTVKDKATNAVLPGAYVELDTGQIATTDANGKYSIPRVLKGTHAGVVSKTGYLSAAMEVVVEARQCVTAADVALDKYDGSGGPPPPPFFP